VTRFLAAIGSAAIAAVAACASPVQAECGSKGVYVFSAYWCAVCKRTEEFLDNNDISYERIETTNNPAVRGYMVENFGTTAVPVVVVDGEHTIGYDADWLNIMLCLE